VIADAAKRTSSDRPDVLILSALLKARASPRNKRRYIYNDITVDKMRCEQLFVYQSSHGN
jgi:hypothetical protein